MTSSTSPVPSSKARGTFERAPFDKAGITPRQIATLMGLSLVVWFLVALFIRFGGAAGVFDGWKGVATYTATLLLTPGLNRRVRQVVGLGPERATLVNSVAAFIPPVLEGVLMRLWPTLYGGDPAVIEAGAIWLLWAIGVGLALSVQTQWQMQARLRPGDRAPRLEALSTTGVEVTVPDPQRRLTHLQFLRFAGCPVCNLKLQAFVRRSAELRAAGVHEVLLFHSDAKFIQEYHAQLPFEVIADPTRGLYRAYGVEKSIWALLSPRAWPNLLRGYHLRSAGPSDSTTLGLPADLLVDEAGRLVDCHYGSHSSDQWTVDDVLRLADGVRSSRREQTDEVALTSEAPA